MKKCLVDGSFKWNFKEQRWIITFFILFYQLVFLSSIYFVYWRVSVLADKTNVKNVDISKIIFVFVYVMRAISDINYWTQSQFISVSKQQLIWYILYAHRTQTHPNGKMKTNTNNCKLIWYQFVNIRTGYSCSLLIFLVMHGNVCVCNDNNDDVMTFLKIWQYLLGQFTVLVLN